MNNNSTSSSRKRKRAPAEDAFHIQTRRVGMNIREFSPPAADSTRTPPLTGSPHETLASPLVLSPPSFDTPLKNPPKLGSSFTATSGANQASSPHVPRLASYAQQRIPAELSGCVYQSPTFLHQCILDNDGCHSEDEDEFHHRTDAIDVLHALTTSPESGITINADGIFSCTPPSYTDTIFPRWFARLANAIAAVPRASINKQHDHAPPSVPSCSACPPAPQIVVAAERGMVWHTLSQSTGLSGTRNERGRPDFLLSAWNSSITPSQDSDNNNRNNTDSLSQWSNVLIVGEHQSSGSSQQVSFCKLAYYAEQVFVAQPFRTFVFAIYTSNRHQRITFWKFDRAGAVRSNAVDFSSTAGNGGLLDLVMCLRRVMRMQPRAIGFHSAAVADGGMMSFARAAASGLILGPLRRHPNIPTDNEHNDDGSARTLNVRLETLTFCAPGLVGRGTRVWKGFLQSQDRNHDDMLDVAIKLSWRGTCRESEASLYKLAQSRKVVGLATLLGVETYEEIHADIRRGHIPTLAVTFNPPPPPSSAQSPRSSSPFTTHTQRNTSSNRSPPPRSITTDEYMTSMASHNRKLTLLVVSPLGVPTSCPSLSPLSVAHALLAGCIGHASLYFDAGILHRDISPNNILACDPPIPIPEWARKDVVGQNTSLGGCLIDLDYAIDVTRLQGSGAAHRTGTWPFISIGVLKGQEHRYRHDLESFFYVFLWLACYPVSTRAEATSNDNDASSPFPKNHPLYKWEAGSALDVATHKGGCIVSDRRDFEILISRFRPDGFNTTPWVQAAWKFRSILWGIKGSKGCMVPDVIARPTKETGGTGLTKTNSTTANTTEVTQGTEEERDPAETYPDEVRCGVSEFEAFIEARSLFEDLVEQISKLDSN